MQKNSITIPQGQTRPSGAHSAEQPSVTGGSSPHVESEGLTRCDHVAACSSTHTNQLFSVPAFHPDL